MKPKIKKWMIVIVLLTAALISALGVSRIAASADFHQKTIASLDEKRTTVLELTAASTAASVAVSMIPGDTASPIANKLADLSGYFLIVLCAIFLEKYLLTITGYAAFVVLIPAALALFAVCVYSHQSVLRQLAKKLLIFGFAIYCVVPVSVKISDLIEQVYDSSLTETINQAQQATEGIEAEKTTESGGLVSSILDQVGDGVANMMDQGKQVLTHFIEALAVMIVTSCLIPIFVLFFFVWLTRVILEVDIPQFGMPKLSQLRHTKKENNP